MYGIEKSHQMQWALINKWYKFLETSHAKANVPDWIDKLQAVVQSQEKRHDEPVDVESENTREEWMILSDLRRPCESNS